MKLIDADEVQKIIDHIRGKYIDTYNRRTKVNQFFWDTIRYIEKKVRSIPTVEAKEVVHGEWIAVTHGRGGHECSTCKTYAPSYASGSENLSNFCPNCGADMRTSAE